MAVLGQSVNLPPLFLGRLRPTKQLTSIQCTFFQQWLKCNVPVWTFKHIKECSNDFDMKLHDSITVYDRLKTFLSMLCTSSGCSLKCVTHIFLKQNLSCFANSVDPDQTEAVWSGPVCFLVCEFVSKSTPNNLVDSHCCCCCLMSTVNS